MSLRLVASTRFPIWDCVVDDLRQRGVPLTRSNYIVASGLEVVEGEHEAYIDRLIELGILTDDRAPRRRRR